MANTNPITKDTTNNVWPYEIEITAAGWSQTHTFTTENKFLDANIAVKAHANEAGAITLSLTDLTSEITMGSATSGYYNPTVSLTGSANIASAGWITSGDKTVTDSSVGIGKVAQSVLKNGTTGISSGTTVNPTASSQTINITAGYNTARTVIIGPISDSPNKATITSGSATVTSLSYSAGSNNDIFNITGSADVSAPTVGTAGYVSNDENASIGGTKNSNPGGATVSTTVAKIIGSTSFSGTATYTPEIAKATLPSGVIDASVTNESATTSSPSSSSTNAWVAIKSSSNTGTLTATPSVTTSGYGTATKHGIAGNSTTVGANESATTYVKIKSATIATPNATPQIGDPTFNTSGTYQNKFTIQVEGDIDKPTVSTEGYISTLNGEDKIGTRSGGSINTTYKAMDRVTVGVDVSGTRDLNHSLSKGSPDSGEEWINAASSENAVTSAPLDGVYVKVSAAALSTTLTSSGKVTAAGYGGTTYVANGTQQYIKAEDTTTTVSAPAANIYVPIKTASNYSLNITNASGSDDVSVSANADENSKYTITANNLSITGTLSAGTAGWFSSNSTTDSDVDGVVAGKIAQATFSINGGAVTVNTAGYVPANFAVTTLATATFGNAVASGKTQSSYTDISNDQNTPALISGSGLYINAGYIGDTYISLSKLVPDADNIVVVSGESAQMLYGVTAYDGTGALITGTIPTYQGAYTVT